MGGLFSFVNKLLDAVFIRGHKNGEPVFLHLLLFVVFAANKWAQK